MVMLLKGQCGEVHLSLVFVLCPIVNLCVLAHSRGMHHYPLTRSCAYQKHPRDFSAQSIAFLANKQALINACCHAW